MKRVFSLIVLLFVLVIALTACGGSSSSPLVGRWQYDHDVGVQVEFYSDGIFATYIEIHGVYTREPDTLEWNQLDNSRIELNGNIATFSIEGDTLELESDTEFMSFTRVR